MSPTNSSQQSISIFAKSDQSSANVNPKIGIVGDTQQVSRFNKTVQNISPDTKFEQIREVVGEELGLELVKIDSRTRFIDLDLDSLTALSMADKLRKKNLGLPKNIFQDCKSLLDMETVVLPMT